MRKLLILMVTLVTALSMHISADAASETTQMNVHATVSADGSCQMAISATVHLDQAADHLQFPLPADASNISLNGSWARTHNADGVRYIDLSRAMGGFAGDFSFTVNYNLPNHVAETEEKLLELRVPLMSGFPYSTRVVEFTITLPGNVSTKPGFTSGYHQAAIEQDLSYTISGSVITGRSQKTLKDHETLEMVMPVTEEMFPQTIILAPNLQEVTIATGVFAALAILYWLIFLRCLPWPGRSQATPPEGYTAGQMHSILHLQGADLTLMIFTWAQLGYVVLEQDRSGKVRIHKQMDMGNERSRLEQKAFRRLFGTHQVADTSSVRYSDLCQQIRKLSPDIRSFMNRHTGNPRVFRILCALVGLCSGVSLGIVMSAGAVLQWPLAALLAIVGFTASYLMQPWLASLFSANRSRFWWMLALAILWIVPAIILQQVSLGLTGAASGLVGGILLFFGGRRTETGYRATQQVSGLYRYFLTVPKSQLLELTRTNPDYFFDLAPYALALGADRLFARRFGSALMPPCPYIWSDRMENLTALRWSEQMRSIQKAMDYRRSHALLERVLRFVGGFMK